MDVEQLPGWRRLVQLVWQRRALWLRADIALAVVVLLVGGGLLVQGALAEPAPVVAVEDRLPLATTVPVTEGPVAVHAAGAVRAPGLYVLASGARVADLIAAAGGALGTADLDRVNLAAVVGDGEQVFVPALGQPLPETVAAADERAATGPIDLNLAPAGRLEDLPGIGPSTARAIIEHRDVHGPFASVDDLVGVPGIGPAKLERVRDLVVVGGG